MTTLLSKSSTFFVCEHADFMSSLRETNVLNVAVYHMDRLWTDLPKPKRYLTNIHDPDYNAF